MSARFRHFVAFALLLVLLLAFCDGAGRRSRTRKGKDNIFQQQESRARRKGKLFSLFNVVQFRNDPCTSQDRSLNGNRLRNGTCLTATQCVDKSGFASGNCAAGFGVCCIFTVGTGQSREVTENCTYIQNPDFPSFTSNPQTNLLTYNIQKCNEDVCQLRLDFETFTILGIAGTDVAFEGLCERDRFGIAQGQPNHRVPIICGENSGHHIYVDAADSTTELGFILDVATTYNRRWDIKVSQIECNNPNRAPNGCLQYHTTLTGRLETFNFSPTNENHLNSQEQCPNVASYSICIRSAPGFCCVRYTVCPDEVSAFSLDTSSNIGMQDDNCPSEYVGIQGSSSFCAQGDNIAYDSKYCSTVLSSNNLASAVEHIPICDCTPPFAVDIRTDGASDAGFTKNVVHSRGVCLDYTQVPCG